MGDVSAVKRDDAGLVPLLDKGEQVHAGVTKVNVHKIGAVTLQQRIECLVLAPVNDGRPSLHEFEPAVHQQICAPLWNDFDGIKRKTLGILHLFGDYEGINTSQCLYLPVNVQHLRLEKARAVTGYDSFAHNTAVSFTRDSRLVHL